MSQVQKGFFVDGQFYTTAKEMNEARRGPLVQAALSSLTGKNPDLVDWLTKNQNAIIASYNAGNMRRVLKNERKALTKALEYVSTTLAADPKAKFVVENANAIAETFKWPGQKRIKAEDKDAAIQEAFLELTGDNAELSAWLLSNKDALEAAYDAGIPKRPMNPKALEALAAGRAKAAAAAAAKK
jgi:Arc/MetJ-type ribon-helix-helix transcriptional regulator